MSTIVLALGIVVTLWIWYNLGRRQGRRQATEQIGANFGQQLRFYKEVADSLLRQQPHQAELHIHMGDEVVDCTSTMETAQFSQALKAVLDWFKPMEQAHSEK